MPIRQGGKLPVRILIRLPLDVLRSIIRFFFGRFFEQFRPDLIVNTVADLNLDLLRKRFGIKLLLIDVDNTLVGHGALKVAQEIIQRIVRRDFQRYLVSNVIFLWPAALERIQSIADQVRAVGWLALDAKKKKPRPEGLEQAIRECKVIPSQAAMIGDGLLTDVLAAKRAQKRCKGRKGPLAVWIRHPIGPEAIHIRYGRRLLERLIAWVLGI